MKKLNEKEIAKLNEIKRVIAGECTKKEASENLGITVRQIDRLIQKFKTEGEEGFAHKGRNKESKKKIPSSIKKEIGDLYLDEYFDYNFTHFYEQIEKKYNISQRTVSSILAERDIISPEAQHKTMSVYRANMKKAIRKKEASEEQIAIFKKREETEKQKHIRRSSLLYNYGEEIQMDAAFAQWYGEKTRALHLAVDKATKRVLFGWFDIQETTRGYFVMLMNIILKYGIPRKIKTDKRGTFSVNNVKSKSALNTTQFGRICNELEIHLSTSSSPTFKPNVERENKTFKGRLISELRHENIKDDEDANKYLNDVFIPNMNAKFAYDIDKERIAMRENRYSFGELNIIISERYARKVDNSSAIKYKGYYYVPVDAETGEIMSFKQNTICTLVVAFDNTTWGFIEDKLYILVQIKAPEKKIPQRTTKTIEEINKSKAHKPAPDHPWRQYKN